MSKCILKTKTINEIKHAVETSKNTREVLNKLGYSICINTSVDINTKKILLDICKNNNINYDHLIKKHNIQNKYIVCKLCGAKLCHNNKSGLCINCYRKYNDEIKINKWLENGDTGCAITSTIRGAIRKYIYKKQNYKCAICGITNIWNDKTLFFILDHIDGNAANNKHDNLRLICPNCDSQLPTYKSKNKNSARRSKRKK